jgi:hypothetical protein
VGLAVAAPIVIVFGLIMYFVIRTELAHDDTTCPFTPVETRELDDGAVVHEEARRCQEDIEEHRWLVVRDGHERELGRRRLPGARYRDGAWSWSTDVTDRGAHVVVENDGVEDAEFYEEPRQGR